MRFFHLSGFLFLVGCQVTAPQAPVLDVPEMWTEGIAEKFAPPEGGGVCRRSISVVDTMPRPAFGIVDSRGNKVWA